MRFLEKLQVIERVDGLIRRKGTGTAEDLANKLGVSRRCVFGIIDVMKRMDAPIVYNTQRRSFEYENPCEFMIGFVDSKKIKGGESSILDEIMISADFLHSSSVHLDYQAHDRDILLTRGMKRSIIN